MLGHDAVREFRRVRQKIGYMPEDDCIFAGLAGIEAVAYAGELAGLSPRNALRRAHEMLDYVGMREERYREVQTYSTGMRQKMKLAQAIVHDPELIFLDEPTSGLDPQARVRMLQLIRGLRTKHGISVVISTHILQDVEDSCDAVLIVSRGRLMVYDTLENLRLTPNPSVEVELRGDRDAFVSALDGSAKVETVGADSARIWGSPSQLSELVFAAAGRSGVAVSRVQPSMNSLEEIFLKAVKGADGADL